MLKTLLWLLVSFAFLALVAGCSNSSSLTGADSSLQSAQAQFSDFLTKIQDITQADIEAALADVHAHGDVDLAALQCLPAVSEFIKLAPTGTAPTIKGVFSANQLKRDVILGGVNNNIYQMAFRKLHTACAAYAGDEARFAAEFAAMAGAASHGVPPIKAIPGAIGAIVPK